MKSPVSTFRISLFGILTVLTPCLAHALSVSVGDTMVAQGARSVGVDIRVDDARGIAGASLTLSYDTSVLMATEVRVTELTSDFSLLPNLGTPGRVRIVLARAMAIPSGSGALVRVFFDVRADAVSGSYQLALVEPQFDGVDQAISVQNVSPGSLTITAPKPPLPAIKVSVGDTTMAQGARGIGVDIRVDDAKGIAGASLFLSYDASILMATEVQTTELTTDFSLTSNLETPGRVRVVLARATAIPSGSGALVRVVFDVKADAMPGVYPLALTESQFGGTDQVIPVQSSVAGAITITGQAPVSGTGIKLSVGKARAEQGTAGVGVEIQVDEAKDIAGADLVLTYDGSVMKATAVQTTYLTADFSLVPNVDTPGQVRIVLARAMAIPSGSGVLVRVVFDVKPDAAAGAYPLRLFRYQIEGIEGTIPVQSASQGEFTITSEKPSFVKTASILVVADNQNSQLDSLLSYYTRALEKNGLTYYDVWRSSTSGEIDANTLGLYKEGVVIWFTPSGGGYLANSATREALKSYLDVGGRLFITGQDIGSSIGGTSFYTGYLHAQFLRDNDDASLLSGREEDPVTEGVEFSILQGDGANNQQRPDEINPVSAAVPILSYGLNSVSTAAIRVETDMYKTVYFAFGFEAINKAEDRERILFSVLKWLNPFLLNPNISSVTPDKGRNQGWVTLTIEGSGFSPDAAATLTKSGYQDIPSRETIVVNSGKITASFDLTGRALGKWDVVTENPQGPTLFLREGFSVDEGSVKLWAEIIGRDRLRVGREQRYWIRVGNSGNTDVWAYALWITTPSNCSFSVDLPLAQDPLPNQKYVVEEESVEPDTSGLLVYGHHLPIGKTETFGLRIRPKESGQDQVRIAVFSDLANWDSEAVNQNGIITRRENLTGAAKTLLGFSDDINTQEIHDTSEPYWFQAGGTWYPPDIPLHQLPPGSIVLRKGGGSGHVGISIGSGEVIEIVPKKPDPGSKMNGTWQRSDLSKWHEGDGGEGLYLGAWAPPGLNEESGERIRTAARGMLENPEVIFGVPALGNKMDCVEGVYEVYRNASVGLPYWWKKRELLSPGEIYERVSGKKWPEERYLWWVLAPSGWFRLQETFNNKIPFVEIQFLIEILMAIDPNEKVGPMGTREERFVNNLESFRYVVFFENKETATAAAQEIVIKDTLSKSLDWNTFKFSDIHFGATSVSVPDSSQKFYTAIHLNDTTDVEINATFDLDEGAVLWHLKGIGQQSAKVLGDSLGDILPPNKNSPEGEGFVSFTVWPKNDLNSGTILQNRASIVFDVNAPIPTNEWSNTIDNSPPTSHVVQADTVEYTKSPIVKWTGFDRGAGIQDYTVYMSEGDSLGSGPFIPWYTNGIDTMATLSGTFGHTYAFYSIARDGCGNIEAMSLEPDAKIRLVSPSISVGDFNGDGEINYTDFFMLVDRFNDTVKTPEDAIFDLDKDGKIGFGDFFILVDHFGEKAGKPVVSAGTASGSGQNRGTAVTSIPVSRDDPEQMEVAVRLVGAKEVRGYGLHLTYDASALKLVEAMGTPGSVLPDRPGKDNPTNGKDRPVEMQSVVLLVSSDSGSTFLADVLVPEKVLVGDIELMRLVFEVLDQKAPRQVRIAGAEVCDRAGRINVLNVKEMQGLPIEYALAQNIPNPFNASTQILYQLPKAEEVSLIVYNILGQQVRVLAQGRQESGYYRTTWDGRNEHGQPVASGIYLVQMHTPEFTRVRKILLLK